MEYVVAVVVVCVCGGEGMGSIEICWRLAVVTAIITIKKFNNKYDFMH